MTSLSCHSPASESAIDAYASRILRLQSPQEAIIDPSVGPYVTSVIRSSLSADDGLSSVSDFSLESILEYDSLIELIQEHCGMEPDVSREVLERIALAVRTGCVGEYSESMPLMRNNAENHANTGSFNRVFDADLSDEQSAIAWTDIVRNTTINNPTRVVHLGVSPYSNSGNIPTKPLDQETTYDEYVISVNPRDQSQIDEHPSFSESPHTSGDRLRKPAKSHQPLSSSFYPSPVRSNSVQTQDYAIPLDLLGVIEDETTNDNDAQLSASISSPTSLKDDSGRKVDPIPQSSVLDSEDKSSLSGNTKNKGKKGKNKATDLAALLFKPSRPRSNSVQESSKSCKLQTPSLPIALSSTSLCVTNASEHGSNATAIAYRQNIESTTQILLSLNPTICEEAAYEAVLVADADIHLAQHVVDGALSAPPVCRHMLNDSCYRSDCQFSHDVDGHTCLFWLRGRCGKGDGCRFLHGFSQKLLDGVKIDYLPNYFRAAAGIDKNETTIREPSTTSSGPISNPSYQPIKTTNLVQHNMKNALMTPSQRALNRSDSFDFHNNMASLRTSSTNNTTSLLLQSNMWKSPSFDSNATLTPSAGNTINGHAQGDIRFSATNSSSKLNHLTSFASIASKGYSEASFSCENDYPDQTSDDYSYVRIPQDLWNSNHNRDSIAFQIVDPIARYIQVSQSVIRSDVIDLHFQSLKTFPIVLSQILPEKLRSHHQVWIISGSGHHVSRNSHQKSGGVLDNAVIEWLEAHEYNFTRGKDKNGYGGAVLVNR